MTKPPLSILRGPDDDLFLTGLLEVEVSVRLPGDRLNPAQSFCVCPDGMDGIWGRGTSIEEACDALVVQMLALLRSPIDLFEALARGHEEIGDLHGATSVPGDGNDKDTWNMYARAQSYRVAVRLLKAARSLAELDGLPVKP